MKAVWKGQVIAESDETIIVEGNHHFPHNVIRKEFLKDSATKTCCGWKGTASYFNVEVEGRENPDSAWYYPEPKTTARELKNFVASWRGIEVIK